MKIRIFVIVLLFTNIGFVSSNPFANIQSNNNLKEVKDNIERYYAWQSINIKKPIKQYNRWLDFNIGRVDDKGNFRSQKLILEEFNKFLNSQKAREQTQNRQWTALGPTNINIDTGFTYWGNGRLNFVRFHPTRKSEFWVGSAGGGLWKTTNEGINWSEVLMPELFDIGYSDLDWASNDTNRMYAATGDCNGYFSSRGNSIGIIRSDDGGSTWELKYPIKELEDGLLISDLVIHPNDKNHLIIGTNQGLKKTLDGGENWTLITSGMPKDSIFIRDIEQKANDPLTLIASTFDFSGITYILKSTDFGETWQLVYRFNKVVRSELSTTAADNNLVLCVATHSDYFNLNSIIRSFDFGTTWDTLDMSNQYDYLIYQSNYNLISKIAPFDKNLYHFGGVRLASSSNAGKSWDSLEFRIHVDHHDLQYNPWTNDLYGCNDGGIYKTTPMKDEWVNISNGMNITQAYRIGNDPWNKDIFYLGTQDNGTIRYKYGKYNHVTWGDGMSAQIFPDKPNEVITSSQGGFIYKSTNSGETFDSFINFRDQERAAFVTNFKISPHNNNEVYLPYQNIWKSSDRGTNWEKITDFGNIDQFRTIEINSKQNGYLYLSNLHNIFTSTDDGLTWTILDKPEPYIASICSDPQNPNRFWFSMLGYTQSEKVYQVVDGKFTNISYNLPNVPASYIIHNDYNNGELFLGTDIGVFRLAPNSQEWEFISQGMPYCVINHLEILYGYGKLRVATFSRGVWETDIFDCPAQSPTIKELKVNTFCFGDSLLLAVENIEDSLEYQWSNGHKGSSQWVVEGGKYYVAAKNSKNCIEASAEIEIEKVEIPEINYIFVGNNPSCPGEEPYLEAYLENAHKYGANYFWGDSIRTKWIILKEEGDYQVKIVNSLGCEKLGPVFKYRKAEKPNVPEIYKFRDSLFTLDNKPATWIFNDSLINDSTYTIQFQGVGEYKINSFNEAKCYSDTLFYKVNPEEKQIKLYYDAFSKKLILNFEFPIDEKITIEVFNLNGNSLYKSEITLISGLDYNEIEMAKFATGVYFVSCSNSRFKEVLKFIKD